MEKYSEEKYSTYILELIRNNGITDDDRRKDKINKVASYSFLLFDYFDVLYCRKLIGEHKKYLNYLSIENVFEETIQHNEDYKVSYKTLSLYCKSGDDQRESAPGSSDFFSVQSEGETLSDTPFLGIIQIGLCKDNYRLNSQQEIGDLDIDDFLKRREEKILRIADNCKPTDEEIQMRRVLFRSSTTGDFCLVVRTNLIRLIYKIAIALNGTQNDVGEKYSMMTFTNVGIECKYVKDYGYVTLDEDVIRRNSEKIALRFSADESICKELKESFKSNITTVEGLFGRYEYLLTIRMKEFATLYPFLCESKLGKTRKNRKTEILEDILSRSLTKNINERILIQLDTHLTDGTRVLSDEGKKSVENKREEEKNEVYNLNNKLFNNIDELRKYKNLFHEEHFAFQDLIRGMIEIYKSFSSAGMDKESYINWRVFHKDMDVLCSSIQEMMGIYDKWVRDGNKSEFNKKKYRGTILGNWRENLNAINRYTTLVQNVNYQTYQSPSYEIQTQIDAEKEMVAYREAMELYITDGMESLKAEGMNEKDAKVYPLIYPDLSKEKVTVTAPFRVKRPDGEMTSRAIICTVPSFEYFARLYDLLPWIIHEMSHHLRVTNRKVRNVFVTDYIFSYIFDALMREPLRRSSDYDFYEADGKAERYLIDCMVTIAEEEMLHQKNFNEYSFEMLILEIEKWLKAMFPLGAEYNTIVRMEKEECLKKQNFDFWLDAYRKEQMLNEQNLELILNVWDNPESLDVKQELAKKLLERYYKNLVDELGDDARDYMVCMEDMNKSVHMEEKRRKLASANGDEHLAVRAYYEQIIAVYRVMKSKSKIPNENEERAIEYLEKVFKHFKDNYEEEIIKNSTIVDTVSMHVMRNLGLLREKSDVFVKEMMRIAQNTDYSQIMDHKEVKQKTYLEAYADILMATSLQLSGFGYCRQVLQTASDANLIDRDYEYEDINYERWRTVAAVLLVKPEEYQKLGAGELLEVDAQELIEDAQTYCAYVIKHISKKLSKKMDKLEENENERERNVKRRKDLRELLLGINAQMNQYLVESDDKIGEVLLLDILLHGDKEVTDETVREEWEKYKEVAGLCEDVKYNFWRLACFCKGIVNIVQDGKIIVSSKLFHHMVDIRKIANVETEKRCKWERKNEFLTAPKRDVGIFYNDPSQVCEKTPDKKLENTIDFIQNYYYFNRFRVVNTFDSESKKA